MKSILYYKYIIINLLLLLAFIINLHKANAQVFSSDQNPPDIRWRQINTENFQILYPTLLEAEAQRMANTLESIIGKVSSTLKKEPRKISIILQNQGTTSNGFVQLAPRRSKFFVTPPQGFDYQDWLNSLAVHELRHVVQFDKLTGKLKAPFFEELALAIFGISLPPWFFEGDAVGIETALTNAGRGRLPSWEITFRTNLLSGKNYSYSKNYLGSVKSLTPGYYQLGYFMSTKLRRNYGTFIFDSILTRISQNPVRPYNFSNSVKKFTGMNTRQLHGATVAELKKLWEQQSANAETIVYPVINRRTNEIPANYFLPVSISSTESLVLKQSRDKIPAFIVLDAQGMERSILKIGPQEEPHFSYASGKIVWDEFRFDKRYKNRSFNVINSYNIATKKYKQLTHKSRLFAPCLSRDGKIIAAIHVALNNQVQVVEFDAETGEELNRYPNPSNYMLQYPCFNARGDKIVVVAVSTEGTTLLEINRETNSSIQLLPFQQQLISRPVYVESRIVFKAHYNGIDNLYQLDVGGIKQLTSAEYGAFNPSYNPQTKQILFNSYQVNGFDVASIPYREGMGDNIKTVPNTFIDYARPLVAQEGNPNVFAKIPVKKYQSTRYREIDNLFYFHSISPIVEENDFSDDLNLGLKIKSNNKLNTLDFYAGYRFNNGLKKSEYLTGFTYKRFYPVLDVQYVNRARLAFVRRSAGGTVSSIPVSWRENATQLGATVPFVFNQLNYTYNIGFNATTSYTSRYDVQNRPSNFNSALTFPLQYELSLNRNSRRSAFDLAPPWGQNIAAAYNHFPFDSKLTGELLTFESLFYTPGLLKNHSFQASFNYQENSGDYNLTVDIPQVSGYGNLTPQAGLRNTLLLDYRFPLFYPDWEIGPLAYIKRLKGGFFADFENIGKGNRFSPRTYGFEVRADMNLLRFYLPNFDVGGKVIFINEKPAQKPIFEFGFMYGF